MKWGMTMAEMHKGYAKALFMISEEDYTKDVIIPEIVEEQTVKERKIVFDENQFNDLISNSNKEIIGMNS